MLPSTKIYKVDFQYLINNALRKKLWGKSWVVFQYDDFVAHMSLAQIDIRNNKLRLNISARDNDNTYFESYFSESVTLPLQEEHYNEGAIKKSFVGAIKDLIRQSEMEYTGKTEEYKQAKRMNRAHEEEIERRAEEELDREGVRNEDIRDAYISSCINRNNVDYAYNVLRHNRYKVYPERYLMLMLFYYPDDKSKYEEMLSLVGVDDKNDPDYVAMKQEMDEYLEAIENDTEDEYLESLEFEIESI